MITDGEGVATALSAAVDRLLAAPVSGYERDELLALVAAVDTQVNRLAAVDAQLIGELDQRQVAGELGARSTANLLTQLLRVAPAAAAARVRAARDLGPRRGLSGEPLPAIFPTTADALADGTISPAHARVVTRTVDAIPGDVAHACLGNGRDLEREVENRLVDQARRLDPRQLGHVAERALAHLDPDGAEPREQELERRRTVDLHARADGSLRLEGDLTPEAAVVWRTILDGLSRPQPEADGVPDPRTAGQRRHDALLDAGHRLLRSDLPDTGGAPVTILVSLTAEQLAEPRGYATTEQGELISAATAVRLADQAAVVACRLNADGGIISYGTTQRLASPAQRRALAARDGGCSFPGCTVPPSWCQAHHVLAWLFGGETNLDNLTLLCGHHHRNFERLDWQCRMRGGRPEWLPPPWLDPDQQPRINTTRDHHLELTTA